MTEPAYVAIAAEYARRILSGDLAPGTMMPSLVEISEQHGVSDIVARNAIKLLRSQGLVRSVHRRGNFVADRTGLVRVSPERQTETAEATFSHESAARMVVEREEASETPAPDLADAFGIEPADGVSHVITRASEDGRPVSISDTYQPSGISGVNDGRGFDLEETLKDQLPAGSHAAWLRTPPGVMVKTIHQRFFDVDGRLIMISDISYPLDRYAAYTFRTSVRPTTN
ncbi:GntR family transcriptional regulator [Catenulispora pinisilvae]|uniref:GntR family transcriptional regulator n=1 Tax=Catenulispora pinisilvae TaxID=2705253 RepID=UPI001892135A|nr:GntR family transcriptional regulator [Catenulispora pinisilvae]